MGYGSGMAKRGGSCHVATIQTKGKDDVVYTSQLLRRSYRDEHGKVRHKNLGVDTRPLRQPPSLTDPRFRSVAQTVVKW